MRIVWTVRSVAVLGLMVAGMILVGPGGSADARPKFKDLFKEEYKNLAEQVEQVKCGVCHYGEKKTNRNDYGQALGKALGKKNESDAKKVKEAFKKVEKEKSGTEGKTFGDLIKEGKLPGKEPEKK